MRTRLPLILAVATLLGASAAQAQVAWDSPMLAVPTPEIGYGIYLFEPAGAGLGVLGTMRTGPIRFRLGIADGSRGNDIAILGGGDYSALLRRRTSDFPLDVGWHLGLGLAYSEYLTLGIPFGIAFGIPIQAEDISLLPFVSPRIILDGAFPDERDSDLDLAFGVDLGIDVRVRPTWGIRFAATLGDHEGLAVGLIF